MTEESAERPPGAAAIDNHADIEEFTGEELKDDYGLTPVDYEVDDEDDEDDEVER